MVGHLGLVMTVNQDLVYRLVFTKYLDIETACLKTIFL